MAMRRRRAKAYIHRQPHVRAEALADGRDLPGGERPVDVARLMSGRHAEQQELAATRLEVRLDLREQRGGRFAVDAGQSGDGFPLGNALDHEERLDELLL